MKNLETLQALIDRAMHPKTPVEEARTSAMAACKMLMSGHFKVTEAVAVRTSRRTWPGTSTGPRYTPQNGVFFILFAKQYIHAARSPATIPLAGTLIVTLCEQAIAIPDKFMEVRNIHTYVDDAFQQWPTRRFCHICGATTADIARRVA